MDLNGVQRGEDPLQNSLIIRHIFRYCTARDQESFRLVCRSWYRNSLKDWRSSRKIIIAPGPVSSRKKTPATITEFKALMNSKFCNYSEMPYDNLSAFDYQKMDRNSKKFFSICGPHLKTVHLENIAFKTVADFQNVVFRYFPNTHEFWLTNFYVKNVSNKSKEYMTTQWQENRNLKSLRFCTAWDSVIVPVSFMELLGHFPSLEDATFCLDHEGLVAMLSSLNTIRRLDPMILKLTKLVVSGFFLDNIPDQFISFLRDPGICLEKLHVEYLSGDNAATTLRDIFQFQGRSLKNLNLRRYRAFGRSLDPNLCIPNYPNTQYLNFEEIGICDGVFNSFDFLRVMHNLRKLRYKAENTSADKAINFANMDGISLRKCKDLHLDFSFYFGRKMSIAALNKIIDWTPNLEELTVSFLDNHTFSLVCERLPNLLSLHLLDSLVDDLGFTGIGRKDVNTINERKTKYFRSITNRKANITWLKNLRHLKIDTCQECEVLGHPTLGYCAAAYGIQEMPSLEKLKFKCSHVKDDETWQNLIAKYPSS